MSTPTIASPQRFYYANGEKIPLVPSQRYMTFRASGKSGEAGAAQAVAALSEVVPGDAGRVMTIPQYGLAIVALDGGGAANIAAGGMSAAALESRVASAGPALTLGPPVFELPNLADDLVVVPVGEVIVQLPEGTTTEQRDQILKKFRPVEVQKDEFVADRYLVRLKNEEDAIDVANALEENDQVVYAEPHLVSIGPPIRGGGGNMSAVALDPLPDEMVGTEPAADDSAQALNAHTVLSPDEAASPLNDPGLASQWGLTRIRAAEAWGIHQGSPNITIAVLDDGCDIRHEDLNLALPGYDAFANDNDPTPGRNDDGHGTACAGIVTMRRGNGRGGVGVAPGCRVLPVRIAQGIGGGSWSTSALIVDRGIRTAVARGASVLSNSYRISPSSTVTAAFQFAATSGRGNLGCVSAAASGNDDVRGIIYPANLSPSIRGFLAVGASNQWDQRKSKTSLDGENWWGSNWGPELDVVAPGVRIYTTDITGAAGYGPGNYITNFNGTSSATPHVAGLAGLILSVDPQLRGWEVEEIIKMTARDLGPAGRDEQFGFGRIDARAALEAAARVWSQVAVTPVFLGTGRECFINLNVRVYNSGINSVRINNILLRSFSPDGNTEVDRFEYRPNPGGTMLARAGHDIRFPKITLRANGSQAGWSHRWTINWSYTFWRPSAPGLPLDALQSGSVEENRTGEAHGSDSGTALPPGLVPAIHDEAGIRNPARADAPHGGVDNLGDTITVDRQSRTITVVIR